EAFAQQTLISRWNDEKEGRLVPPPFSFMVGLSGIEIHFPGNHSLFRQQPFSANLLPKQTSIHNQSNYPLLLLIPTIAITGRKARLRGILPPDIEMIQHLEVKNKGGQDLYLWQDLYQGVS
ncbi:MAG TPA: hypothetical protein DIT24_00415, partial [Synergistaceae bacterium]|nr:hypothetical protein [Synergistaceae bacterium]